MEAPNITKAATFKSFFHGSYKNTQSLFCDSVSGAQLGGKGRPPLLFFENQKKCSDSEKKALTVSIFRLNLPFKM